MKKIWYVVGALILLLMMGFLVFFFYFKFYFNITVDVSGPTEAEWGELIIYTVKVTNTGGLYLPNVTVSDSLGFINWTGRLEAGASKTFYIELRGGGKGTHNFVKAEGYTETGKYVCGDYDSWTVRVPIPTYSLTDAINEGFISAEFRGTGACAGDVMRLKITPKLELEIKVEIAPGLILINSGVGQNMIIAETRDVSVEPEVELKFDIEAYCLDAHRLNPSRDETFSIQAEPGLYDEDVIRLMRSLKDTPQTMTVVQIALWVITDDISEEDIRIPYTAEDIENARELLENAGINISTKKLFQ